MNNSGSKSAAHELRVRYLRNILGLACHSDSPDDRALLLSLSYHSGRLELHRHSLRRMPCLVIVDLSVIRVGALADNSQTDSAFCPYLSLSRDLIRLERGFELRIFRHGPGKTDHFLDHVTFYDRL